MGKPIYRLFLIKNDVAGNLAMKALPESERKALWDKEQASREAVGAATVVLCNSAWADEEHPFWGVLRFPDLQACIEHTRTLDKIGWFNYVIAFTLLGTSEAEPAPVTVLNPIYKLWIVKSNPAAALNSSLPKGLDALRWEKHHALYRENSSQILLSCHSDWSNEAYRGFGVSAYPDVEANARVMAGLNDLGWPQFLYVDSYLGIKAE